MECREKGSLLKGHSRSSLIILLAISMVISFCIERIYSISNHSIEDSTKLITSLKKKSDFVPLMGADEFMTSSYTLFKERINLNMWHGHQFLEFEKAESLYFELFLSNQATVDLVLGGQVVRLRKGDKAILYDFNGELSNPIELLIEIEDKNKILYEKGTYFINSKKLIDSVEAVRIRNHGTEESSLEKISIEGSPLKLRPSFSWSLFLIGVMVLAVAFFLISSLKAISIGVSVSIISVLCYFFYIFYFQGIYLFEYFERPESEANLISEESLRVSEELKLKKNSVLFIGSSQTFGEGASKETKRWTDLYCAKKEIDNCLNIAIRSAVSQTFVDLQEDIIKSSPDKIFFVLSYNDRDPEKHRKNIDLLFKEWSALKIPVIAILEPSTQALNNLSPLHYNILSIARKYSIRAMDPTGLFKLKDDLSWNWWDNIHLTDHGHMLLANYIEESEERN